MVAVLGVPCRGRGTTTFTNPTFMTRPRRLPFFEQAIIEPAARVKLLLQKTTLLVIRVQPVLARLTHGSSNACVLTRRGAIPPLAQDQGLSGPFCKLLASVRVHRIKRRNTVCSARYFIAIHGGASSPSCASLSC